MALLTRKLDRSRLSPKDVQTLGTTGDWTYASFDGAEYILDQQPLESGLVARPCAENEIRITERRQRMTLGTLEEFVQTVRGLAVPSGTYAAAAAKAARTAARYAAIHHPRPVDVLASLPFLAGRSDMFIGGAAASESPERSALRQVGNLPPRGAFVAGRRPGPDRVGEIIDRLTSKHITLRVASGKLIVSAPRGKLLLDQIEAITRAERLLIGRISGSPVSCELGHGKATPPPAVTLLALDVGACAEHADGTLEVH